MQQASSRGPGSSRDDRVCREHQGALLPEGGVTALGSWGCVGSLGLSTFLPMKGRLARIRVLWTWADPCTQLPPTPLFRGSRGSPFTPTLRSALPPLPSWSRACRGDTSPDVETWRTWFESRVCTSHCPGEATREPGPQALGGGKGPTRCPAPHACGDSWARPGQRGDMLASQPTGEAGRAPFSSGWAGASWGDEHPQ